MKDRQMQALFYRIILETDDPTKSFGRKKKVFKIQDWMDATVATLFLSDQL